MKGICNLVGAFLVSTACASGTVAFADTETPNQSYVNGGFLSAGMTINFQCYEPERDSPEKIEKLKAMGGKICPVQCFDKVKDPRHLVKSRERRRAKPCKYLYANSQRVTPLGFMLFVSS